MLTTRPCATQYGVENQIFNVDNLVNRKAFGKAYPLCQLVSTCSNHAKPDSLQEITSPFPTLTTTLFHSFNNTES